MQDLKLNEIPVEGSTKEFDGNTRPMSDDEAAELIKSKRAGLSVFDTVAAGPTMSVGGRGVDTSGVSAGAGAGAGSTLVTPATPGESPAPDIAKGTQGTGTIAHGDSDFEGFTSKK